MLGTPSELAHPLLTATVTEQSRLGARAGLPKGTKPSTLPGISELQLA